MSKLILVLAVFTVAVVVVMGLETSTRPKTCAAGTQYSKGCNTCTCGATPSADKCSKFDCDKLKSSSTTPKTPSGVRPGTCPTKVTPRPGIDDCSKRNNTSVCQVDKDCPAAKKCCANGCNKNECRNAIYQY